MTTEHPQLEINGIAVEVVRKNIKHLHLAVYPPNGKVRIAVPMQIGHDQIRLAVIARLGWIRQQQQTLLQQERQSKREMVSGESHFVCGQRYRLNVITGDKRPTIVIRNHNILELRLPPGTDPEQRYQLLQNWYRQRLQQQIPALLLHWQALIGVSVAACRIKRMKTKWGSCNPEARRIWINLELAKKPYHCLEYILVHEMVHLLERHHNDRFQGFMDRFLPAWRLRKQELNRTPLAHEKWQY